MGMLSHEFEGVEDFTNDIDCIYTPKLRFWELNPGEFEFTKETINLPMGERTELQRKSMENLVVLARASFLTYKKSGHLQREAALWGFTKVTAVSDRDTDVQAFVLSNDTDVVVVFRGTSSRRDLLVDVDLRKETRLQWGKTHRGFNWGYSGGNRTSANGIQSQIFEELYQHGYDVNLWIPLKSRPTDPKEMLTFDVVEKPKKRLWITGHSAGGALAQLMAADLLQREVYVKGSESESVEECLARKELSYVQNVVTFGSPRVGDLNFSQCFDENFKSRIWRVDYNNDIVSQIPSKALFYRHAGRVLHIRADFQILVEPTAIQSFLDRTYGIIVNTLRGDAGALADGIRDHFGYVNTLQHNFDPRCEPFHATAKESTTPR